ncbi:RNA polymerase sigma factor [Saccharibacillus sp. CPCC 101409]|uniref:RNA polymerase sigma factor n=1 Tax=Saccharibacillus sp. CPCC 101409 TaxID=3058041 RepID=UPI0026727BF8|nr:RNA polymerase sigma factor [Saccharibacillus sp. CPCC 101409]MDO3413393.1 RNA polymerase sigma factor [Saccharibacillus sp. CPCC 101409]
MKKTGLNNISGISNPAERRRLSDAASGEKRSAFVELMDEHGEALGKYCRFLAGSQTDSEELAQDMWMKAWTAFETGERIWNRTYLRRIAYHAWVDRLRKSRDEAEPLERIEAAASQSDPLRLWTAAELLVRLLTPEQRTVYLLIEHLRFTAAETAELIGTTEGGAKAALRRARLKLEAHRLEDDLRRPSRQDEDPAGERLVFAYLEAIRLQDVRALLVLWNGGGADEASAAARCGAGVQARSAPLYSEGPQPRAGGSERFSSLLPTLQAA